MPVHEKVSPGETPSGEHPPTSTVPSDNIPDDVPIQPIDDPNVHTPMDDTPLSQRKEPMVETIDKEEDIAPQARLPKTPHGAPNPDETPRDFTLEEPLKTDQPTIPNLPPEEMIGRTFLMPPQEDGTRLHAKILERVHASREELKANPDLIKFKCKLGDIELDEIVAYNDIVDYRG